MPSRSIVHSDSSQLLKMAVLTGDVVGLTRYDVSRDDIRSGRLRELQLDLEPDALGHLTLGLVFRRNAELSAAARQLIAEIRDECSRYV